MRPALVQIVFFSFLMSGCSGALIEHVAGGEPTATPSRQAVFELTPAGPSGESSPSATFVATVNGYALTELDLVQLASAYGLHIEHGDYWYDPVSGAWGYWGGPTAGFLMPYMELGFPPLEASGGGTGVVLNGRELHPQDLTALQQLLGPIYPGYYWLDASGNYGYEGGPAIGNLIYLAQGYGGAGGASMGGGYHDSTYFGYLGSDGQSSYFYDSDTGCSVMSDGGGVSC